MQVGTDKIKMALAKVILVRQGFLNLLLGTKYERKLKLQEQITPERGKLYLASIKVMSCRSRIFVVS